MYLVINLGLKSIRGIVYNQLGEKIENVNFIINTKITNNFIEQNPHEYIQKLKKILLFLKKRKLTPYLRAISVTTSANCLIGLSKQFKPKTKVLTVLDFRANDLKYVKRTKDQVLLDPSHNLSKIIWLKKKDPKIFKSCKYWVNSSDYLVYFLTKQLFTDNLNFEKFLIKDLQVSKKILSKYGIKYLNLPTQKKIGDSINLSDFLIKNYGFSKKCKYIVTTYDAICACIGSVNSKNIYSNAAEVSGTVTSIRILSKKKPKSTDTLKVSYIPLINRYLLGLSNNLGGGIIEWYKSFFKKKNFYESLRKSYLKGKNYFYFFPFIFGDRDLGFHQTSRGIFFGLGSNNNIDDLTKSVVDSAAFTSKYLFDRIQKNRSVKKIKTVTLSGGLARLKFLNEIKSQLYGVKTYISKDFESTSLGCLILILVSHSGKKFEEIIKIIKLKKITKKKNNSIKHRYNFFINFLKNNKSLFNISDHTLDKKKSHKRNL